MSTICKIYMSPNELASLIGSVPNNHSRNGVIVDLAVMHHRDKEQGELRGLDENKKKGRDKKVFDVFFF